MQVCHKPATAQLDGWCILYFFFFNEDVFAASVAQAVCNTGGWVVMKQNNIMARNA